jgi:Tol biopolymer transport system component
MSDDPITRLNAALEGRYRIESELGEGGMATVYLADDLKHERKVAVKVLKPELAAVVGAERFLAEIKTTANLQHPHILPLFDSGEADTYLFYVMPLVEGESLREKLDREKQLGVEDALDLAKKVADALDYAHENGVVHRDIKPGNILLSARGEPLLGDFGIALAVAEAGGGRITETGLSLGTPHYMSPEQASGDRDVDPRSDVYALGCVLYEMLAGEPPFSASTAQAILAKILTMDAPSITVVRRTVPPNVGAALAKSLEKLPADRFASAAEFGAALGDASFTYQARPVTGVSTTTEVVPGSTSPTRLWLLDPRSLAVLAVTVIAVWGWLRLATGISEGEGIHLEMSLPPGQEFMEFIAISPAGDQVAYVAKENDGPAQLYLRYTDTFEARLVTGSEGATYPFFSHDGESVAFASGGQLHRVAVAGGAPVPITEAPLFRGGSWGPDDTIVFALYGVGLLRVTALGGTPEPLVLADDATIGYGPTGPQFMPDGENVIFTSWKNNRAQVAVVSIATGEWEIVYDDGPGAQFIESGHLLFSPSESESRPSELRAIRFDPERLGAIGGPVSVLDEVMYSNGRAAFAVSSSGTLVYVRSSGKRSLVWVDREGAERVLPEEPGRYGSPVISPDGSRVALKDFVDIWVIDIERGTRNPLSPGGDNRDPVWTPLGNQIVFASNRDGNWEPYSMSADGGGGLEKILERDGMQTPMDWSPDGNVLAFWERDAEQDIWMLPLGGEPAAFLSKPFNQTSGRFSRNGRFLAYVSDESGREQVYVVPYPVPDRTYPISADGGTEPVWAHSGEELFYRRGEELVAVEVDTDQEFSIGASRTLFRGPYVSRTLTENRAHYDVARDDQSFLMVRRDAGSIPTRINVVFDFFEELRERVPN